MTRKQQRLLVLASLSIALVLLCTLGYQQRDLPSLLGHSETSGKSALPGGADTNVLYPEVYATLLTGQKNPHNETDHYYNATRVLIHRLLYNPATRDHRPIVVFVTPDVMQFKRERLMRDGAQVREVPKISFLEAIGGTKPSWMKADPARWKYGGTTSYRWKDQFTKLQLFGMEEYGKIVYMDSDIFPLKYLGDLFEVSRPKYLQSVLTSPNFKPALRIRVDDEPGRPDNFTHKSHMETFQESLSSYGVPVQKFFPFIFYAVSDPGGSRVNQTGPPVRGSDLNAGLMVFAPSRAHHTRLKTLALRPELWNYGRFMEQDLLRFAYNQSGRIPWQHLDWRYNGLWAKRTDLELGMRTIHGKSWLVGSETEMAAELYVLYWKALGQMEEYWRVKEMQEV